MSDQSWGKLCSLKIIGLRMGRKGWSGVGGGVIYSSASAAAGAQSFPGFFIAEVYILLARL